MAATACAYAYDGGLVPPAPAPEMGPFDDGGHHRPIFHDHYSVIHGLVMPPPPPPPPPPPFLHLHSGHAGSKAAASRHPGLCTEGLGSESSESSGDLDLAGIVADDDIEDCKRQQQDEQELGTLMPARRRAFPPPISVIGAAGKPWQYLRAQRGGGRLVLREVRIPSRELLHACREDGRLKLHFAHPEPEPEEEENNSI